jgi:hypothetical protein
VTHNKDIPKGDVDELRQIAVDTGDYSKTLPSLKSLAALSLAALSIIGTVLGIFDIPVPLYAILSEGSLSTVLTVLFLFFSIAFGITVSPFIAAFYFKRYLFEDNKSKDAGVVRHVRHSNRVNLTQLYNSSLYKKEDRLFDLLGGRKLKPKEVPIDVVFRISVVSLVFGSLALNVTFYNMDAPPGSEDTINYYGLRPQISPIAFVIFTVIFFPGYTYLVIIYYKRRVKAGLV